MTAVSFFVVTFAPLSAFVHMMTISLSKPFPVPVGLTVLNVITRSFCCCLFCCSEVPWKCYRELSCFVRHLSSSAFPGAHQPLGLPSAGSFVSQAFQFFPSHPCTSFPAFSTSREGLSLFSIHILTQESDLSIRKLITD